MFNFTPIERSVYDETVKKQSHRASEPRDTIFSDLVQPFLDANTETAGMGVTEDGRAIGITWNDLPESVQDMIAAKDKPQDVSTIQSTINQTQNRERWHVYCKVVKNADNSVGFLLVNETLETARNKAEAEARKQAAVDANAEKSAA